MSDPAVASVSRAEIAQQTGQVLIEYIRYVCYAPKHQHIFLVFDDGSSYDALLSEQQFIPLFIENMFVLRVARTVQPTEHAIPIVWNVYMFHEQGAILESELQPFLHFASLDMNIHLREGEDLGYVTYSQ